MKLPPFWTKDARSWFTLAESTFNRCGVADPWLRFDLVLPALPEEVIEQIRGILHAVRTQHAAQEKGCQGRQEPGEAVLQPPEVWRPDVEVCGSPHLHVVGKRVGPAVAAAAAAPKGTLGCLLYLVDVDNSKRYLVDSGSAFSILPHKSSAEPTGPRLMTADGMTLHCWAAAHALSTP